MQRFLLAIITLALLVPSLVDAPLQTTLLYNGKEKFDARLSGITSIKHLEDYTDSIAAEKKIAAGSYEYVNLLGDILENRFYHGFSHYSLQENWIAAIAGKLLKEDYACKVHPDEILKHDNAACSQQALVMMQVLRDKNIIYRSLGFPHHYAIEIYTEGQWYFFDTNMEPAITREQRSLANWKHQNEILKRYYTASKHEDVNYQFGINQTAKTGAINEIPAQRAATFHLVTGMLSKLSWLFPLTMLFFQGGFKIEIPFLLELMRKRKPLVSFPA